MSREKQKYRNSVFTIITVQMYLYLVNHQAYPEQT